MPQSSDSNEITRFDGPEKISGHHFSRTLMQLQDDSIDIDELISLLEKHPETVDVLFAEVHEVTEHSDLLREVRSLKHAVLLLGMNRIHDLLTRETSGPPLTIRRTA